MDRSMIIFIIIIIICIILVIKIFNILNNKKSEHYQQDMIPKNIFQTHKSMEYIQTKPEILDAVNSWKKFDNKFNYYFYNDTESEKFIKDNFDADVYKAYMKLPAPVMKADLWRYCIVYFYGGIYADTDTVCKIDPELLLRNDSLLVLTPENKVHLCQWIFAAPKKSPVLDTIIKLSVKKILEKDVITGEHIIHELTGPGLFTEGIELFLKNNKLPTFDDKFKYVNYPNDCIYVFPPNYFHENNIVHLFSGQHGDGWINSRP